MNFVVELLELELLSWIGQNSSCLKVAILPHSDKGSAFKCENQRYLSYCQTHLKPNAFP